MRHHQTMRAKAAILAAVLAGMLSLGGLACAAAPVASSDAELRIEEATSSRFAISGVQVRRKPGALSVSGDVSRIIPHRGLIYGEVEVRVVGPDGVVLAEDSTTPMRRNRQARSAHFFVRLPIDAPAGSTLQIVHRRG